MNTKAKLTPEMEANKWKRGEPSPNPSGRPRKGPISEAYAHLVGKPLPDDIRSKLGLSKEATWADALAVTQMRSALKGNTVAAKEIADRVEGRVPLPMKVEPSEENEIRVTVTRLGPPFVPKELTNGSQEKQTDSQNLAAIKPEPRWPQRKPWE